MKRDHRDCFCALCRTPRKLRYERKMRARHMGQILVLTISLAAILYPWLSWKGVLSLPIVWVIFEYTRSSLYRKDLICPYCGFDPAWYKKDVKMARAKVEEFLKQNPESLKIKKIQQSDDYILSQLR